MPDGHFDALPEGFSGPGLTRSGKFVDVEILGGLTVGGSITGGTITGGTITGGAISGGTITGTTISGGTIVAADMYSDNWDGTTPLALPDTGATLGWALDASTGIIQAQDLRAKGGTLTTLTIDGTLTFSTGAILRTAASGTRIELSTGNPAQLFYYRDAETTATAPSVSRTSSQMWFGGGTVGHPTIILYPAEELPAAGYVPYKILIGASSYNTTIGGILAVQAGTAAAPSLAFTSDADTGMYRSGADIIGFAAGGTNTVSVTTVGIRVADGSASLPSVTFLADTNTGLYRAADDSLSLTAGGTAYVGAVNTGVAATSGPFIYNVSTTASAANLYANTGTGQILVSTSSARYKTDIQTADWLADRPLRPVQFWSITDEKHQYGLIAEEVRDSLGVDSVELNSDGLVENYDVRAVVAALVAKINRLEGKLNGLQLA